MRDAASGAGYSIWEPFLRPMNLPIVHCNRLDKKQPGRILRSKQNWCWQCRPFHIMRSGDPVQGQSVADGPYGGPQPRVAAADPSSGEVLRLLGSSSL